jgi:hypothetical protein
MPDKVFISSTKIDLSRHRAAVRDALLENGFFPVEMEDFGARDVDPETGSLRLVAESQLFVGIYAWRYGYVPPGAERSITAEELEQARRLGKPRFYFLVDETYSWPADPEVPAESAEQGERLRALKESLRREQMVATFGTPEQLALQVATALNKWQQAKVQAPPRPLQLLDLLDKVERFWIKDELERSLPASGLLMRDREERPGDVAQPWQMPGWAASGAARLLPPRTPVDLFVGCGRRLLILGEGGCGKTIDLLQLARGLAALARDDASQPVPVVLKLGPWGRGSRRLDDWMASEIHKRHKLDPALVQGWIESDSLLPLLDGLDEVEPSCRDACAQAIDEFLAAHTKCGMAVTCRGDVNDELGQRLDLRAAYALRPLSDAALDRLAAAAGAATLRAALREPGWRELARTPLFLLMMERVLSAGGATDLGTLAARPAGSGLPDLDGDRRRVLAAYVQQMLEGRLSERPLTFPPARTRRGLAWLAGQMSRRHMALFQLDELQPSWLGGPARMWTYAIASRALGGALLMLPVALLRPAPFLLLVGLAVGAAAGLLDGQRLRAPAAPAGTVRPLSQRPAARALAVGGAAMACFLLFGALSLALVGGLRWRLDLADGLRYGLFFGVLLGLVFGLRRGRGERGDTEIAAGLSRSRWSWSKSLRGAAWPPLLVALWCLIEWLRRALTGYSRFAGMGGLQFCLLLAVVASALGGLVGGLLGDVEEDPAGTRRRRPGLRPAFAATARAGWHALLGAAAVLWAVLLALASFSRFGAEEWRAPAFAALTLGLWTALALRGLDLVQHLSLRLLLAAAGVFPLRWVRFLDQAVACNLMHRAGAGYQFIHPWLAAELAEPALPARPPLVEAGLPQQGRSAAPGAGAAAGGPQ